MRFFFVFLILFFNALIVTNFVFADLNDGLVLYLPFDGNTDDHSGNNNHGTATGNLNFSDDSIKGKSAHFNGTDSYIRFLNPTQLFESEFTISAWVYTHGKGGVIFSKYSWGAPGGGKGFTLSLTTENGDGTGFNGSTLFPCILFNEGWYPKKYPTYTLTNNKFYYVSTVYDHGNIKLFIDGNLVSEKNINSNSLNNSFDLLMGTYFDHNGQRIVASWTKHTFSGLVDEFRLYNRSLSNSEITELFKQKDDTFADSDGDGVIDQWDSCPKTPKNSCVNNKGCSCDLSLISEKGSVSQGKWKTYYTTVDNAYSNLIVKIMNLTDDVDLYVQHGNKPDFDNYDCRPYKGGNRDETCDLKNSGDNLWYFSVYGYKSGNFSISVKAKR